MSKLYSEMTRSELMHEQELCMAELEALKAQGLKLNMARGKPGREQLDMVSDILTVLTDADDCFSDGVDARNYGELAGLKKGKRVSFSPVFSAARLRSASSAVTHRSSLCMTPFQRRILTASITPPARGTSLKR